MSYVSIRWKTRLSRNSRIRILLRLILSQGALELVLACAASALKGCENDNNVSMVISLIKFEHVVSTMSGGDV